MPSKWVAGGMGGSLLGSIGGHHAFGPPGTGAGSKGRDSRG